MPNSTPTFKTAKEGVQILYIQFREFLNTRAATCPNISEIEKLEKEIIARIEKSNSVHREERYKELEEKLKKAQYSEQKRREERRKFWMWFFGIAFVFMSSMVGLFTLLLRVAGCL